MLVTRTLSFVCCALLVPASALGREQIPGAGDECRGDITADDGFTVRSVEVVSRGGWLPDLDLPIAAGDAYSPVLVSDAVSVVGERERESTRQGLNLLSQVAVSYVDSCVRVTGLSLVDVQIRTWSLRWSPSQSLADLLPRPRSNRSTFFGAVPRPLLALNPTFGAEQDRDFGFSASTGLKADLLQIPSVLAGEVAASATTQLEVQASARKSVSEPFYDSNVGLQYAKLDVSNAVQKLAFDARFDADHRPIAGASNLTNAASAGVHINLGFEFGPFTQAGVGGRYRRSGNRVTDISSFEAQSEDSFQANLVADGRLFGGFSRVAVWFDVNRPDAGTGYHRLAGMFGFEKELALAPNQSIGVEAVLAGGRSWGNVPRYAGFYGGNNSASLLYEEFDSPSLSAMPSGPVVRSLGASQAAAPAPGQRNLRGTSYWGVNLNVSVPVPAWARPLIPDIDVGDGLTLRRVLTSQVRTSRSMLEANLKGQRGLSEEEARREADSIIGEIQPTVDFIADQANLFSIKPLVMLDAARIGASGSSGNRVRVAIGGGIQLTVVIAKFEAGYMRTVRGLDQDDRGNVVTRLVFQNLF